ncbi:MAG: hypothetical protein N2653_01990 [Burkholderiales bacterium]|nr:hypothetical protein [Burkholderiales bacterium]
MRRAVRLVLLAVLVAGLPIRAAASVAALSCAGAGHDAPSHAQKPGASDRVSAHHGETGSEPGSGAAAHHGEEGSGSLGHDCGFCAKHCSGTTFAPVAEAPRLAGVSDSDRIPFGARPNVGFVPDHPERPPLGL